MSMSATIPSSDVRRTRTPRGKAQRWSALLGGGALAAYGLSRRSPVGILMAATGGSIAILGATARATTAEPQAQASMLLNCSPSQAYQFWHNFENLPLFMRHLESVTLTGDRRSRWVAIGPLGRPISWDTEIIEDRENQRISWRSLPGSDVNVDGFVEFRPAPANRGTIVIAQVRFRPPAGHLGANVAKLLGKEPSFMMRQDLRRMKALIEAGEIPTIEGQSHGPRTFKAGVARVLNPDRPIRRGATIAEVIRAERRIS